MGGKCDTRREIQIKKHPSLGFQDIREGVTLRRLTSRGLRRTS